MTEINKDNKDDKEDKSTNSLKFYFSVYGGWPEVYRSNYSRFAFAISIICFPFWSTEPWWEDVINVIPNLLGFTLGGYAMLMAFGDTEFQKRLAEKSENEKHSALININATFVHFIILQSLSLIFAFICKSYYFEPSGWLLTIVELINPANLILTLMFYFAGFYLFIYALLSIIAATFAILRLMKVYDYLLRSRENEEGKK